MLVLTSAKSRPHVQLIRAELPSKGSSEPLSESLSKLSSHQIPHSPVPEGTTTAKGLYANFFFVLNHYAFGGVRAQALSVLVLSTSTTGSSRRVPPPRGSRLAVPARGSLFVFLQVVRWLRTRRFHARWIRCRRPVSGTGPLTLRLCLRLHFCRRLRAVGTCSRASGGVSRARLSTSSTSLFPRLAQLRCTSPSRSATAHSRCPRSFGPEASFTEWLGRFNHWIWVEITCPAFLGVPLCPTLWHWLVHINTGPRNSQDRPSHSRCQAIHARNFFSPSKGEERAWIPAEFRARIFKPVTG